MTDSDNDVLRRLELARRIAREAGRLTMQYFQRDFDVERKSDDSPVTIVDREAEQLLRQRILDEFPHDAILGEEFPETTGTSGYRWIVDPIDGTKSFIHGVPLYGTIVGVERDEQSVIGVIQLPGLNDGVYAASGHGAWHQRGDDEPQRANVSRCPRLREGLFLTSELDGFVERGALEAFHQLDRSAWISRTWGDCYGYFLVATGRAVAMVDAIMNVWDAAGIRPILEEAGGTFTDWQGRATIHSGEGVGTNGLVLDEVLAITRPFPSSDRP